MGNPARTLNYLASQAGLRLPQNWFASGGPLLLAGGHIGYDVRPTARRQGHATAMLRAALPRAHDQGIDPVLVTCDVDNLASRRVIQANRGVREDGRGSILRFWIPTDRP